MINNLSNLKSDDKNPTKRKLHGKMIRQAMIIAVKFPVGKCTKEMVDKYSALVDYYYKKFPDKESHDRVKIKLSKLYGMIK